MNDAALVPLPEGTRADLVLEGGGVKGIGLVGAVLTLSDAGFRFPRVAGTERGRDHRGDRCSIAAAGKPLTALQGYVDSVTTPSSRPGVVA